MYGGYATEMPHRGTEARVSGTAKAEASLARGQEDTGGGEGAGSAGSAGVSTLQEPQQLCAGVPCGAEQEEGALWRQ